MGWSTRLAVICGFVSASLGSVVLIGWWIGNTTLIQVLPNLAAMQVNTAICFVLGGFGLVFSERRSLAPLLGSPLVLIGGLTLAEYAFNANLSIDQLFQSEDLLQGISHPGRMGPNTAQCFLIVGAALLLFRFFTPMRTWVPTAVGILGLLTLLIGGAGLTGYAVGTQSEFGWYQWSRMAVHTAVGFLVLGTGLLTKAHDWSSRCRVSTASPHLAYAVTFAVMLAVLLVWHVLVKKDQAEIKNETAQVTNLLVDRIGLELRSTMQVLKRMAARWQVSPELTPQALTLDAELAREGFPYLRSIEFLGDDGQRIASAGSASLELLTPESSTSGFTGQRVAIIQSAGSAWMSVFLPADPPMAKKGIQALIDLRDFVERSLANEAVGYAFMVTVDGQLAFARDLAPTNFPGPWDRKRELQAHGMVWRFAVTPNREYLSSSHQVVPVLLLFFGALLAFLTGISLHSARNAELRAAEAECSNESLQQEMASRRHAEESLRISDERYTLAVRATSNGMWDWNIVTNEDYISDRWMELLGYEPGELPKHISTWEEALHPEDRPRVHAAVKRNLEEGLPYFCEMRLRNKDGSYRWYLSEGNAIRDEQGKPVRMTGFITDIHDRKLAQDALQESELRFRSLTEAIPHMVWTASAEGRNEYFNQSWLDYTGLTLKESLGWGWQWMLHPDDRAVCMQRWYLALETGQPYEIECRFKRGSDSAFRWHISRAVAIRDRDGQVVRWVGTCTDIHDQKKIQEALQSSEARFRAVAEAIPQVIWSTRPDGYTDYFNSRWYEYSGLTPESSEGWAWQSILHPDDRERCLAHWESAVASGTPYEIEYRLRRARDRTYRWHLGRGIPLVGTDGEIVRWFGTSTDIEDQIQARRAIEQSQQRYRSLAVASGKMVWSSDSRREPGAPYFDWDALTGQTAEESANWGWLNAIHPEDRAETRRAWQKAQENHSEYKVEYRICLKDVGYRYFAIHGVPLRRDDGAVEWIGTAVDIHDQRMAAEQIRHSEERYRSLVRVTSSIVWTTDSRGHFTTMQESWESYTGQTPAASFGRGWLSAIHDDDRASFLETWEEAIRRRSVFRGEGRIWHAGTSQYRYFMACATPLIAADNSVREWVGALNDVDDQRQAEEALRELNRTLEARVAERTAAAESRAVELERSEADLRNQTVILQSILDGMADGAVVADIHGRILQFNPAAQAMTGRNDLDESSSDWSGYYGLYETDGKTMLSPTEIPLRRAMAGVAVDDRELIIRPLGGRDDVWVSASARPLREASGEIWGGVVVFRDITAQRQMRAQLQQSEERLRLALAAARMGTWEWNPETNRLRWSEHDSAVIGSTPASFEGELEDVLDVVFPADRDSFEQYVREILSARSESTYIAWTFRVDVENRGPHWLCISGKVTRAEDGRARTVIGTFRDVTEQVQNDRLLLLQAQIVANMAEGALLVRASDLHIVYANAKFNTIFGYEEEELIGRPAAILNAHGAQTPEAVASEIVEQVLSQGEWSGEVENVRKNGERFWCRANVSSFDHPEHGLVFIAVQAEITEEKRAQAQLASHAAALARSRESLWTQTRILRSVLDSMREAVIVTNEEGRFVLGNRAAEVICGSDISESTLFQGCTSCTSDDCECDDGSPIQRALRGEAVDDAEVTLRTELMPEDRIYSINARPIMNVTGEAGGGVVVLHDITERQKAADQIQSSLREKEVMIKEIHHRVKNNLQVISSLLSLQSGQLKDDAIRTLFDESQHRIRSMALVHESLYRSEDLAQVDFRRYVETLADSLVDSYRMPGAAIKVDFDLEPISFSIDHAVPCGLILNELISNALKHAFPQQAAGRITIELRSLTDGRVRLAVADDGRGIPESFEIENVASLGMRIVRNLTEQLRGAIHIERGNGLTVAVQFMPKQKRLS